MGMVLILEGLPYFAFPEKIKVFMMKIMDTPDRVLRILGFTSMLFGLVLVYFGTN
jgi:uncharacterized protein YjeT (DUF2065 family)